MKPLIDKSSNSAELRNFSALETKIQSQFLEALDISSPFLFEQTVPGVNAVIINCTCCLKFLVEPPSNNGSS